MTIATSADAPDRAGPPAHLGPGAERGRTTIAARAVERVAAHAVTEVDGVGGSTSRVLGVPLDTGPEHAAAVTARVTGHTATLEVRLSVIYPRSVARATQNVRTHLTRRVRELTGLTVVWVDITVTALHSGATSTRRVE